MCVGLQVPAGLHWHDAQTTAILHSEEHECFFYCNKGLLHKHSWQSCIMLETFFFKKKLFLEVSVNCSWFHNNQHMWGPVQIWQPGWGQSAACDGERPFKIWLRSGEDDWASLCLLGPGIYNISAGPFLRWLFKNHLHYVGVLSSDAANVKFIPEPNGERRTWSREQRVNEAGRTYPGWNDTTRLQLSFTFLWGLSEQYFYALKNLRLSSWRQKKSLIKFWCQALGCTLENWLHLCSVDSSTEDVPQLPHFYHFLTLVSSHNTLIYFPLLPACSWNINTCGATQDSVGNHFTSFFSLIKFHF